MSMFDDYDFEVEAVNPSGIVSVSDGKVSATRKFAVRSENAEELGLRLLGKYFLDGFYETPVLPAKYPSERFSLVAKSFDIEQLSACKFELPNDLVFITDLEDEGQLEQYLTGENSTDSHAVVTVQYSEPDWDCDGVEGVEAETALSLEINPAYEMFTLPNRNLIWDIAVEGDREFKGDSYAYKIIPKSDVIVSWHNIPVSEMNIVLNGLKEYRGTVNEFSWGSVLFCESSGADIFEPETLMFIDAEEDRSKRTTGFRGPTWTMDTTTLKLHFKEKDIFEDNMHYGWNHLFLDNSKNGASVTSLWTKVRKKNGTETSPLFELKSFANIFTWTSP